MSEDPAVQAAAEALKEMFFGNDGKAEVRIEGVDEVYEWDAQEMAEVACRAARPHIAFRMDEVQQAEQRIARLEAALREARDVVVAQRSLLACYRTGSQPRGKVLDTLAARRDVVDHIDQALTGEGS